MEGYKLEMSKLPVNLSNLSEFLTSDFNFHLGALQQSQKPFKPCSGLDSTLKAERSVSVSESSPVRQSLTSLEAEGAVFNQLLGRVFATTSSLAEETCLAEVAL